MKISNTIAYVVKNPVVGADYFPITDSQTLDLQTKTTTLDVIRQFFLSGLSPVVGGTIGITEIEPETEETSPATVANALSPAYSVGAYEFVFLNLNGHQYLLKLPNITIGVGGETLTNDDFITFPINTGPTGPTGPTGATGATGAAGTNGTNGTNADMTRTSVTSNAIANSGSKTFAYTASTNLGWLVGTRLRFANDASNYMEGPVTAVSSTSVTIEVDNSAGSGTYASWNIGIAGDKGVAGVDNAIVTENTGGTLTITTQSDVEIDYVIDFQIDGNRVMVSGYVDVTAAAGKPVNTEVFEFIDSDYDARTGNSTVIIGSNGVSGDNAFLLFSTNKLILSQATAAPVRLTFNGFYSTNLLSIFKLIANWRNYEIS